MKVLITRPQKQAENLAVSLRQQSINSICFPAIDIVAPSDLNALQQTLTHLAEFNVLIFVSPNAANIFLKQSANLKITQAVFAIGKGTTRLLEENGIKVTAYPQKANSEMLLALPPLQNVTNKRVAIFAGEAGNFLLANTLVERGAEVTMAYTHRRSLAEHTLPLPWKAGEVDVSICTSLTGLHNFRTMIDRYELNALLVTPLLVITVAMQTAARQLGFKSAIILAKGASDSEIAAALQSYSLGEK